MTNYLRCRACDFLAEEGALGDVCPACGLPRTVFEPYPKQISERRRSLAGRHFHPIGVHLPQVLLLGCILLPIPGRFLPAPLGAELLVLAKWSVLLMPFAALLAFITGLVDGRLRFKKLETPLLRSKMRVGAAFLALTVVISVVYLVAGFGTASTWIIVALGLVAGRCAFYLGRTGASMFNCILPG